MLARQEAMKELSLLVSFVGLCFASASPAYAQEAQEPAPADEAQSASMESPKGCFSACRKGYVCHPDKQACVSLCNPFCAEWEACSEAAECVAQREATAKPGGELVDRRFEKPVSKYVTVGGLISNYWLRPQRSSNGLVDLRAIDPNEYALDISPFVKP
jgi:hypothetical protein